MKKLIFALLLTLPACATKYGPVGFSGGYKDTQLAKDMFKVSFDGNGFTSKTAVHEMFLRRCAEITHENGAVYFVFLEDNDDTNLYNLTTETNGQVSKNYYGGVSYHETARTSAIAKHRSDGVIKIFKEGEQPPNAYDARYILKKYQEIAGS